MNQAEIANLLGIAPPNLDAEVQAAISEHLRILELVIGRPFVKPKVRYDLKGTTAGQANSNNIIRLNLLALTHSDPQIVDYMFNQTIPHEVCHIIEYQLYSRGGHGDNWQQLMRILNCPPKTTHNLPLPKVRGNHPYVCRCSRWQLSTTIHNRIRKGQIRECPNCGRKLVYDYDYDSND